jgi:putative restriction endonuclease
VIPVSPPSASPGPIVCGENPKPEEFGSAGQNWENVGWKVRVHFISLTNAVRPKDHMAVLGPVLPDLYSPLQANGNGNQGVYLTEVPRVFAEVLEGLIGSEATALIRADEIVSDDVEDLHHQSGDDLENWEHIIETRIEMDNSVRETEKAALIRARRGQGLFKERVAVIEDGENGLLLTQHRSPV